ncbi:uncharacterized protein [Dysidea avara]|uniref:uncharacterized protein isoform X2 n=1 Tax=Dysidea avara TaxID=196820 RepID=UPI0033278E11
MNESDVLLRLLKCKSEVEKAKRDKEACHVQIRTCTLELDTVNEMISSGSSRGNAIAKVIPTGSQLDQLVKIMISNGILSSDDLTAILGSDDTVEEVRENLICKAMLYLNQDREYKRDIEKENLGTLAVNLQSIEQELQDTGCNSTNLPSQVNIDEEDIDDLTAELTNLREKVQEYTRTHEIWMYQGQWAPSTYEPYQMEALNAVNDIMEQVVENVLKLVGPSPVEYMQNIEKLLLHTSKEQFAEGAIQLLTHQTVIDIGMKLLNEVVEDMCQEVAQLIDKAVIVAFDIAERITAVQLHVKKIETSHTGLRKEATLKKIFNQMKIDRSQSESCWRHSQLLTRWAVDGKAKEIVNCRKRSDVTEVKLPRDALLRGVAEQLREGNEIEMFLKKLSLTLQDTKAIKYISAISLSPNQQYVALGTTTGQLFIYNCNDASPVSESITSKDKHTQIHLSWSLDSSYFLCVTSDGGVECWQLFAEKFTSVGLCVPQIIVRLCEDDYKLKGSINLLTGSQVTLAKFYPSFSLLGIQPWVMLGMSSGDIIKCCIMTDIYSMETPVECVLSLQNDYPVELFRGHEKSLVSIVFCDLIGAMFSLDVTYNLCQWDYSKEGFSGYGWYIPRKCYRLMFELNMYAPVPDVPSKIRYDNKLEKSHERQTNAEKQQIYKRAWDEVKSLKRSFILWEEKEKTDLIKQFYVPANTEDSTFLCHIVTMDKNQRLQSYVLNTYQIIEIIPFKLLSCYQTFSGKEIVFSLLYCHELMGSSQSVSVTLDLSSIEFSSSVKSVKQFNSYLNKMPYMLYKYLNQ